MLQDTTLSYMGQKKDLRKTLLNGNEEFSRGGSSFTGSEPLCLGKKQVLNRSTASNGGLRGAGGFEILLPIGP